MSCSTAATQQMVHITVWFGLVFQMKDLREAVLKLEAADKLRSQGFLRSEQNLPKTNKKGE